MAASFKRNHKGNMQDDSNILSVFFGTDAFLLEDELNELQWSQIEARAELTRAQYTSGILSDFNLVQIDADNSYLESADGKPLTVLVDGYAIKVGGNAVTNPLSKDYRLLFNTTPENNATEDDNLHYLEFWFEVVNQSQTLRKFGGEDTAVISNKMLDTRLNQETSRRIQMKWRVYYSYTSNMTVKGFTSMGDNLYKKTAAPTYDASGNLLNPGVTYAVVFAKGTHSTQGNPVVHNEAKAKLKPNNIRKELVQGESIVLNDLNNNFEATNVAQALDESEIKTNAVTEVRAEIIRQMTYSGVISGGSKREVWNAMPYNSIQLYSTGNTAIVVNEVPILGGANDYIVNINGNILNLGGGYNAGDTTLLQVNLSAPPTYGTRDDVIFLEAFWTLKKPGDSIYKYNGIGNTVERTATTYEKVMEWRIRNVAGVDFDLFADGIEYSYIGGRPYNFKVQAQGNNSAPLQSTNEDDRNLWGFYGSSSRRLYNSKLPHPIDDVGLYIAGDGTQTAKSSLKTMDGYVYAIPLFRVKRRNNGGYRPDNINGGKNYYQFNTSTVIAAPADNKTYKVTTTAAANASFGDTILWRNSTTDRVERIGKVIAKDDTSVTVYFDDEITGWSLLIGNKLTLSSDRPDSKFANIIEKEDFIDLRRKVSLSGVNYKKILEESFDKLLRGELRVKDKSIMAKETFGLLKAHPNMPKQLMPRKIICDDGVERDLVNLVGNYKDISKYYVSNAVTSTIGLSTGGYVKVHSGTNNYGFGLATDVVLNNTKYYVALVDIQNDFAQDNSTILFARNGATVIKQSATVTRGLVYVKLSPTDIGNYPFISFYSRAISSTTVTSALRLKELRVYEIDKATYDKIDVDAAFTGNELAKKYPYISSYPNILDNLFDMSKATYNNTRIDSSTGNLVSSLNGGYSDYIAIKPNTYYDYNYIMSGVRAERLAHFAFYDTNKTFISGGVELYKTLSPSNAAFLRITVPMQEESKYTVLISESFIKCYVPYGRWLVPYDYFNSDTPTRITDYQGAIQRKIWSDKQITESVTDIISPISNSHIPHVTVTQATAGRWSIGDTIKVRNVEGIVGGIIDADTALAKIVRSSTGLSNQVYVDDVSKFVVGDNIVGYDNNLSTIYTINTITAIDTTNKILTLGSTVTPRAGYYLFESTVSTSSPIVTATGIIGTWSNLATKEATYTINTVPTSNTSLIKINYSISFPAGKGMNNLASEVLEVSVNGDKYTKDTDNYVVIRSSYDGKTQGNMDLIPSVFRRTTTNGGRTTLATPTDLTDLIEADNQTYGWIMKLDNTTAGSTTYTSGKISQHIFSYNIIRIIEDKFGDSVFSDCSNLVEKITKAKNNLQYISGRWNGYGNGPTGNLATLGVWDFVEGRWKVFGNGQYHSNATVTLLQSSSGSSNVILPDAWKNMIDASGYIHFSAYAEASDGVKASNIYTDYAELQLRYDVTDANYDIYTPEVEFPILVDDPRRFKEGENMLPPLSAWTVNSAAKVLGEYELELNATASGQQSRCKIRVMPNTTYRISAELGTDVNTRIYVSPDALGYTTITATLYPAMQTVTFNSGSNTELYVVIHNTSTGGGYFKWKNFIMTAGDANRPFVPFNKNIKRRRRLSYLGKIAGSSFENPHRIGYEDSNNLTSAPSVFNYDVSQYTYDLVRIQEGTLYSVQSAIAGNYTKRVFEFDFSHLGLSLTELKSVLRKVTISWTGYGEGDNRGVLTNGALIKTWKISEDGVATTPFWSNGLNQGSATNTANSPTMTSFLLNSGSPITDRITTDQKMYVMVHTTYPASSTIPAKLYTDYISMDIELADYIDYVKGNVVKIQKETKELKLQYPKYSFKTGMDDVVDIHYKTVPYQGLGKSAGKIVAMDNKLTVLTYGTGNNSLSTTSYRNSSYRLPKTSASGYKDHQLVEDSLDSSEFYFDSKIMTFPISYATNAGYGLTALYASSVYDPAPVTSKDTLTSSVPHLTVLGYLVMIDGELRLKVRTNFSNDTAISNAGSDIDDYYIEGRPIIRG